MSSQAQGLLDSGYVTRRKELLALLKKLRAIGSQNELDLPRIAVIGNQSAGKSSVVEAISGITVPRDAGTCTRCPMECRLSSSTTWTCQIFIRREFDKSGRLLDKVSELPFGDPIRNKDQLEFALWRAQVAVLNPHLPLSSFLAHSGDQLCKHPFVSKDTLSFSRDTICVDLEGPELTELAFVDLPGLIQNAPSKIVHLVEDMVISYIKGNCLILVAMPMTDDIENQKALQLARQVDRDGQRTIGVLTKPDMLSPGSTKARNLWLDVIEGRRHPLVHGYYCTRQPDDMERMSKVSFRKARSAETEFFESTHPWSKSNHKDRFGTDHLVSALSKLLVEIIDSALPRIRSETSRKLEECLSDHVRLPKPVDDDPPAYILRLLNNFCDQMQRHIKGSIDDNMLIHRNRDAFVAFKRAIRQTAPNFIPVLKGKETGDLRVAGVDELSEAEPMYLSDMKRHVQKSVTRELPNNIPFQAKEVLILQFQADWKVAVDKCFSAVRRSVQDAIELTLKAVFGRYENLEKHMRILILEIIQQHQEKCLSMLEPILKVEMTPYTQNCHYLSESCDKWLGLYRNYRVKYKNRPPTKLRRVELEVTSASPVLASSMPQFTFSAPMTSSRQLPLSARLQSPRTSRRRKGIREFVPPPGSNLRSESDCELESDTETTLQSSGSSSAAAAGSKKDTSLADAKSNPKKRTLNPPSTSESESDGEDDGNCKQREAEYVDSQEKEAQLKSVLAQLATLGYTGVTADDLDKLNKVDEYETELNVMAEVRGYFQIAYKRIIDNVPSLIDLMFVKAIGDQMQDSLVRKLDLFSRSGNENCAMLLEESSIIAEKRKELMARQEKLEEVNRALQTFGL